MTIEEEAKVYFAKLKQLGYEKRNYGRWMEEIIDTGDGFPEVKRTCPFCNHETYENYPFCPKCGAKVGEE